MKEEILEFLKWAENNRATSLFRTDGYDEPTRLWDNEVEELIEDYIICHS